jgi:hypothetical protein
VANKSINRQTLNLAQMFVKQIKDSKPQTNPYEQYLERIVTIIKKQRVSNLTSYMEEAGLDFSELHFMNGFNDNEY